MRKVLELPAYRRLLATTIFNELAVSIGAVALAILVYRRTGSAIGAAAFFLCVDFGPAFVSPLFVARLDQRSVRRVLAVLYALEGLVFVVLSWLVGRFALGPVLILALVDGIFGLTARVLSRAAWTSATSAAGLMRDASAVINASLSICYLVGPALGGAVVAMGGTRAALLANVGVFALMTLTVATAPGLPRGSTERQPAVGRLRAAVGVARAEPLIRRLLSLQAVAMLFFAISIPIEVVFAQHTLHAGAGGYGVLLSAWGGGAIVGSTIYARWRTLPLRALITLGTALLAAGFLVMAIAPTLAIAIIGAAIGGVGNGIQIVAMRTALQEAVSERWMALILSLNESMFQAVPGLGIMLGGAIGALAGPRIALATGAAGSLGVAVAMWVKLKTAGQPPSAETPDAAEIADSDPALTFSTPRP